MLSETMTLADKTGVGSDRLYEWLEEFYPAPSALGYGKKVSAVCWVRWTRWTRRTRADIAWHSQILTNNFHGENGFTLDGGIKE